MVAIVIFFVYFWVWERLQGDPVLEVMCVRMSTLPPEVQHPRLLHLLTALHRKATCVTPCFPLLKLCHLRIYRSSLEPETYFLPKPYTLKAHLLSRWLAGIILGLKQMSEEGKPCDRVFWGPRTKRQRNEHHKPSVERTDQPSDLCLPETLLMIDAN